MTIDSTRHGKALDDPTGHIGPKLPTDDPQPGSEGHVGPKLPTDDPQPDSEGHVGPKIDPKGPLNLGSIPQGSSLDFNLTMTNLNDSAQNWSWQASTPISSLTVNTPPDIIQAGGQETISATVRTTGLASGNYGPILIFTFTPYNTSTTVTIQFSVN